MDLTAKKFVSSLVKSLQILCNGHLDFAEGIELVGHINVNIDKKLKFNCILDELVTKQDNESTTFFSHSYPSLPPPFSTSKSDMEEHDMEVLLPDFPPPQSLTLNASSQPLDGPSNDFSVALNKATDKEISAVKMEGEPSARLDVSTASAAESLNSTFLEAGLPTDTTEAKDGEVTSDVQGVSSQTSEKCASMAKNTSLESPEDVNTENEETDSKLVETFGDVKNLITKLHDLCDLIMMQNNVDGKSSKGVLAMKQVPGDEMMAAKKTILQSIDKSQIKKIKEVLQTKKGPQRTQELRALVMEMGFTNEQLCILAQESPLSNKGRMRGFTGKKDFMKEYSIVPKSFRRKTLERQERLLEMADILKKNKLYDSGLTVLTKTGSKKCTLLKSSMSVISHNTLQLSIENIDQAVDILSCSSKKDSFLPKRNDDCQKDPHKKHVVKRRIKQIVGKMLDEIIDSGYRVVLNVTVGSDPSSQTADLSILPLKVDDIYPENRDADMKSEMSEEEYAKRLEREHFIEKQKSNEEKMREMEMKLTRILSGTDAIFIPSRKNYILGPKDAEQMKEYRKKLKADPEKYQVYKQKRSMNKKRCRLSALTAKIKQGTSGGSGLPCKASRGGEEPPHNVSQSPMASLVNISQPGVAAVEMHCPQVYGHPPSHQPAVVSVHHSNQFVGQVPGMHTSHQQPITYENEMDIVELIAASHNVQNQHFG